MKITRLESFTVAVPFKAPILSAFGVSYPARIRTFIRLHTDEGLTGIGETGPSALHYVNRESLITRFDKSVAPAVVGEDPFDFNWIRRKLYNSGDAVAVEIACWDLIAKKAGVPLYRLLGGHGEKVGVPVAGYCFFRAPARDGTGGVTPDTFVDHCLSVKAEGGYSVLKLKFGSNRPETEVALAAKLRASAGPELGMRVDPNGSWSLTTALQMLKRLEPIDLEYIEEPIRVQGPADATTATALLKRLRSISATPIAADHCYRTDLLAQIIREDAADVVLADVFGAGGIEPAINFCRLAGAFGLGVAMHSGAELCVGQVVKLHVHAAMPDVVTHAGDSIYPEYADGVLQGGKLQIRDGSMAVPQTPGLGVDLDPVRLARWELTADWHRELDAFWDHTKAMIGVTYPTSDMLMRHY
ncbi:MAG: mandelate racemase/muconate lactonizing enzyme family protein [Chloroflexi bacterium]|nr:mandelate racemase/muconate lactonizing enzyme family protein [Chloroflexota bacterium]